MNVVTILYKHSISNFKLHIYTSRPGQNYALYNLIYRTVLLHIYFLNKLFCSLRVYKDKERNIKANSLIINNYFHRKYKQTPFKYNI